jgi:hypothetical protein
MAAATAKPVTTHRRRAFCSENTFMKHSPQIVALWPPNQPHHACDQTQNGLERAEVLAVF